MLYGAIIAALAAILLSTIGRRHLTTVAGTLVGWAYLLMTWQTQPPVDLRLAAILIIALGALIAADLGRFRSSSIVVASLGWVAVSTTWSRGENATIYAQASLAIAMILATSIRLPNLQLARIFSALFWSTILAVAASRFAGTGYWELGGRLTGPFINPNTLGAVLLFTWPAAARVSGRFWTIPATLTLATVWQTGARAALLAFLIQFALLFWSRTSRVSRLILTSGTIAVLNFTLGDLVSEIRGTGAGSESVLRSNNSRSTVWAASQNIIDGGPWYGYGLGSPETKFETGSSFFSLQITGGIALLIAATLAIVMALLFAVQKLGFFSWQFGTLLGGTIHSLFEGWVVAPGSLFSLMFWVLVAQALRAPSRLPDRETSSERAAPRMRTNRQARGPRIQRSPI